MEQPNEELPEFPQEEVEEQELDENAYVEVQEQVKTLMTDYAKGIFDEMKKDQEFVDTHDVAIIESVIGTLNAVISNYNWDRIARDITGKPIILVSKYDILDVDVVDGFKFGLQGVSTEYNEVFKTEEERNQAIIDAGLVVYNG